MTHSARPLVVTAALLIAATVAANAAFVGLGAVFDYPEVLQRPPAEVLGLFRRNEPQVVLWFLVLIAGAVLLAPVAVRVGALGTAPTLRASVPVGIAASVVQVVGLARWPLLVPALAQSAADPGTAQDAETRFQFWGTVLGTVLGESAGYALTAAWTVLVAIGLPGLQRWLRGMGLVSAVLIAGGVLAPFGVPVVDRANFAGYVLWSIWLVALAVVFIGRAVRVRRESSLE